VLVECGFLSNKSEALLAASPDYRQHLADKIAEAICEQRYGVKSAPANESQTAQASTATPRRSRIRV